MSGSSRSLVSTTNPNNYTQPTLDSANVIPFSISPVVTAWTTANVSTATGSQLSYSVYGAPVAVTTTQNPDGSVTFAGTISGTNSSGLADDGNTCTFTITLKTDNSFAFDQAMWIRAGATRPDPSANDYLNIYTHAWGTGQLDSTGQYYSASATEYMVDFNNDKVVYTTSQARSTAQGIAVLATSNSASANGSATWDPIISDWPTGQYGASTTAVPGAPNGWDAACQAAQSGTLDSNYTWLGYNLLTPGADAQAIANILNAVYVADFGGTGPSTAQNVVGGWGGTQGLIGMISATQALANLQPIFSNWQ